MATRLTRAERAAATRRDLLEVAERRFFADGYHGTRLDDVAEEAGYTKGAVYSAYQSKAGLFLALYDQIVEQRIREIRELLSEHETEDGRLDALARAAGRRSQRAVPHPGDRVPHSRGPRRGPARRDFSTPRAPPCQPGRARARLTGRWLPRPGQ